MRMRRALAAAAVTIGTMVGGTVAVSGTAYAYGCAEDTAPSWSSAHGWHLQVCKWQDGPGSAELYWQAWTDDSNSTDVRVWYADPCGGSDPTWSSESSQVVDPARGASWVTYYANDCDWQAKLTESNTTYIWPVHAP